MGDLHTALFSIPRYFDHRTGSLSVPAGFYPPAFWATLSAFAFSNAIPKENLALAQDLVGYASAIGLSRALWGDDDYMFERVNEGRNYSSLEHLSGPEATDVATSRVNSCIRRFMADDVPDRFITRLAGVVGDLHDNVWSHGKASGFSLAQKWKVPREEDHYLEFALADHGLGFLGELRRVGREVESAEEAIEWCIEEGHSTKKSPPGPDWTQSVPGDLWDNPLRGVEKTKSTDNHHMGLGLFHLTELVETFSGELWLATADKIFLLTSTGKRLYITLGYPWQGVALACRFRLSRVRSAVSSGSDVDPDLQDLMEKLGGAYHD